MGEKTEKASPKKLRDARKKGQVAKSQDLPSAFTFIVSMATAIGMSGFFYHQMADFLRGSFELVQRGELTTVLGTMLHQAIMIIFLTSMPILAVVCLVGVAVNFFAVGPIFALEALKPDIKKFNPIDNLKAKFKMKTLVELIKSLFKVFVAAWLVYGVTERSIPVLIQSVTLPMTGMLMIFSTFLWDVIMKVGLFFIFVAILDFAYQKYNFANEMKMEKFEIKQEYKNTEGDPHIKGKRKEIAKELAYSESSVTGTKKANAVVTNPTHLAIALAYDKDVDAAPYIVAMGSGSTAETIIKLADQYNIPTLRNVPLAHELWERGELFQYVPDDTYKAIAEILRWVASLREVQPAEIDMG